MHVSGHGSREEMKLMLALLRPRYVMPVHGEYRMLADHAELAVEMGVPPENIVVAQDGDVIEVSPDTGIASSTTCRAAMSMWTGWALATLARWCCATGGCSPVMACSSSWSRWTAIPGSRRRAGYHLARLRLRARVGGAIGGARPMVEEAITRHTQQRGPSSDWNFIKNKIRDSLGEYVYQQIKRRPMILPVVVEV